MRILENSGILGSDGLSYEAMLLFKSRVAKWGTKTAQLLTSESLFIELGMYLRNLAIFERIYYAQ